MSLKINSSIESTKLINDLYTLYKAGEDRSSSVELTLGENNELQITKKESIVNTILVWMGFRKTQTLYLEYTDKYKKLLNNKNIKTIINHQISNELILKKIQSDNIPSILNMWHGPCYETFERSAQLAKGYDRIINGAPEITTIFNCTFKIGFNFNL